MDTSSITPEEIACISERQGSIRTAGKSKTAIHCADDSLAGSVSQRACVFCGARVVLNPVTDAVHLVKKSEELQYVPPETGMETYIRIAQERGKI